MTARNSGVRWWVGLSWFWLAMLVPSLVFSNGRWQLAIAALATPFFARLFLLSQPVVRGLLILLPLQIGAYLVMWWEVIPAPGVLYYIIAAAYGLCYFLPFVVDRITSIRIAGFASTLVLPVSWYLVEILVQVFTPYGSWSSAGYTQMGHGLFTPLAAWVGVAGVAFVTIWVSSVAAWMVTTTTPTRRRALVSALWAGSMLVVVLLARTPLVNDSADASAVSVAGITPSNEATLGVSRAVQAAREKGDFDREILVRLESVASELNDDLFMRSRDAAQNGARLIVWSETAGRTLDSHEDRLIPRDRNSHATRASIFSWVLVCCIRAANRLWKIK